MIGSIIRFILKKSETWGGWRRRLWDIDTRDKILIISVGWKGLGSHDVDCVHHSDRTSIHAQEAKVADGIQEDPNAFVRSFGCLHCHFRPSQAFQCRVLL